METFPSHLMRGKKQKYHKIQIVFLTSLRTTSNFLTNTRVTIFNVVIMAKMVIRVKMIIIVKIVIMVEMSSWSSCSS